jgi:ABC-type lipoprotein export system ATPase subunit
MVTHDSAIASHTERTIHLLDGKIAHIQQNGKAKLVVEGEVR